MNLRTIRNALQAVDQLLEWEMDIVEDFHLFAHRFGAQPGSNVYEFVLHNALKFRGLTLEQLREAKREGGRE